LLNWFRLKKLFIILSITLFMIILIVLPCYAASPSFDTARVETTRITAFGGAEPDNYSYYPAVSGDGRYVAFESRASNLVSGGSTAFSSIYVYDSQQNTVQLISYDEEGVEFDEIFHAGITENGILFETAYLADITSDGRYVSFVANNSPGRSYIYVRDMLTGTTNALGVYCNGNDIPKISNNGQYITYVRSGNLLAYDITTGTEFVVDNSSFNSSISGDGRYIAYQYWDSINRISQIWVYDIQTKSKVRIDKYSDGTFSTRGGGAPKISSDGRYVAFTSWDWELTATDHTYYGDHIYVYDRDTDEDGIYDEQGAFTTILASKSSSGEPANEDSDDEGEGTAFSDNGRYVTFVSYADNLVLGDTNENIDLFVHDIVEEKTIRVSVSSEGGQIDSWDYLHYPAISSDGLTTAYVCDSPNLVNGDTNGQLDVFISRIVDDIAPNLTIQSAEDLTESNLDQAVLTLNLYNETFNTVNLEAGDFTLNNAPQGLAVGSITNVTGNSFSITLDFDGTDFDSDFIDFRVTVAGNKLTGGESVTSNSLLIIGELEPGQFQFSNSEYSVNRSSGLALLTVTRTNGDDGWVGLEYSTIEDTAIDGVDYTGASWETLSFQDGETSKDITINILENSNSEGDNKSFYVHLYLYEGGGSLGIPVQATVTIVEDGDDIFPPIITGTSPSQGNDEVAVNTDVEIHFNENIKVKDIDLITFKDQEGTVVDYAYEINHNRIILNPVEDLEYLITYNIEILPGSVTDAVYNEYQDSYTLSFTTEPELIVDTEPPTWPGDSNLTVSGLGRTSLTLNWTEAVDNVGVASYRILKGDQVLTTVQGNQFNYQVTGLSSGTAYTFQVEAGDAAGNWSSNGPSCTATTNSSAPSSSPLKDTEPPFWSSVAELIVKDQTNDSLMLKWPRAKDNVGVSGYIVLMNGNVLDTTSSSNRQYKIDNLNPNIIYTFMVKARDAAGNVSVDNPTIITSIEIRLVSLSIDPPKVIGGDMKSVGTAVLSRPAIEDTIIKLTSDNEKNIKMPETVTVREKDTFVTFDIETFPVRELKKVEITASYEADEVSAALEITPPYEYILEDLGSIGKTLRVDLKTSLEMDDAVTLPKASLIFAANKNNVMVGQLETEIEDKDQKLKVMRGFRYSSSYGLQEIGTLGGLNSSAMGINESGYIVGWAETLNHMSVDSKLEDEFQPIRHAFIAEPGTGVMNPQQMFWVEIASPRLIDIGTLGGRSSEALSVNSLCHIVGISNIDISTETSAFVYTPAKGMRDLNYLIDPTLEWKIDKAYDIDDKGIIMAEGIVDGEKHVCRLIPVYPLEIYGEGLQLEDIKPMDWFYENVSILSAKEVISGYPDGTFKPNNSTNADEFLKMIVTALGYTEISSGQNYWAEPYLEKAKELGIIQDGDSITFTSPITREEMAMVIVRAVGDNFTINFEDYKEEILDFDTTHPGMKEHVLKAYSAGIINGFPDGEFRPKDLTTRAQAASVIVRAVNLINKGGVQ